MQLPQLNTAILGGKYRRKRVLGQEDFGIVKNSIYCLKS